jgi:cell division protein FtsQ
MFFKRAPKNRRIGREFVLDVKLRSSQVRARRVRTAALLLGGFFLAVGSVYMAWRATEAGLDFLLYRNPAFAVLNVDVQTDGMIAPDQVRRWTGVRPGENLFALDLGTVRRNLQMISMIDSVSLEKILPHTLHLQVTEREPIAQISILQPRPGGGADVAPRYLDSQGYVILPLTPAQCAPGAIPPGVEQLPSITGVNANEAQPGRQVESPQVRAALELILAFQRSPMQGLADIARVDVSSGDVLVVKTGQGSEITFGLEDFDQQLLRWQAISYKAQQLNKAIATLDLAVSNSIPATLLETNAVQQVSVRTFKPLRNKKKHV